MKVIRREFQLLHPFTSADIDHAADCIGSLFSNTESISLYSMAPKKYNAAKSKSNSGAAKPVPRQTTFIDVLIPELIGTFACALTHHMERQDPGTGIKKLRMLSKGARSAIQKAVKGYTLKLGSPMGDPKAQPDSPSLATFLNKSQLRSLVVIVNLPGSETGENYKGARGM